MSVNLDESIDTTLCALQSGDQEVFDSFYFKYQERVMANVLKLVRSINYAEDLVQEVFLAFWENRQKMRSLDDIPGWLFVVSYNKALTFLNKKLKESTFLLEFAEIENKEVFFDIDDDSSYEKQAAILFDAIDILPKRKREVFRQCRLEGKTVDIVAIQMGISVGAVRNYLKQSLKAVRVHIQKKYPAQLASFAGLLWALAAV